MIYEFNGKRPEISGERVFIAPGADLIGAVELHEDVSIWFNVTLRGDIEPILVGERSNIQDGSTVHTDSGLPVHIGKGVTIGHNCVIHGCTVGDDSMVGMGSTVLSGARIGKNCLIGAGSLVSGGTVIPDGSLALGSPARVIKALNPHMLQKIIDNGRNYTDKKNIYLQAGIGSGGGRSSE